MIDITNPRNMQTYPHTPFFYNIDIDDRYVYAGATYGSGMPYEGGLLVLDYSARVDTPRVIAHYDTNAVINAISVDGNRVAYNAQYSSSDFRNVIADISNPAAPRFVTSFGTAASQIKLIGNNLLALTRNSDFSRLQIWDITDRLHPVLTGSIDSLDENGASFSVSGNRLLVSTANVFTLYDISTALPVAEFTRASLLESYALSNYPNPFNAQTTIRYSLPVAGDVRLDVFNALGQRVTSLQPGRQSVGEYSVPIDASGFSSGEYIVRMLVNDRAIQHRKMILVK